jgi:hypothetical protein
MSERPDADKAIGGATTERVMPPVTAPTPPKASDHPTTAEKPGTGTKEPPKKEPPKRGDMPDKVFANGYVTHPDGYIAGRWIDGTTYMYNPKDGSYGHWDAEDKVWRDPETGAPRPEGWAGGHDDQIQLGTVKGGFTSPPEGEARP